MRVQANINLEQKNEIEALQQRLLQVKSEFQGQIGEYKKIFDMKAARIHKLEMQLRESTYGQVSKNVNVNNLMSQTVHTPSGQSLFEIHILQANLTKEFILKLGTDEPQIFATWTFYEHDMQYTPVIKGSKPHFDCSAYYKVLTKMFQNSFTWTRSSSISRGYGTGVPGVALATPRFLNLIYKYF